VLQRLPAGKLLLVKAGASARLVAVPDGAEPAPGAPRKGDTLVDDKAGDLLLLVRSANEELLVVVDFVAVVLEDELCCSDE